jgi:hypothetical protein
MPQYSYKSVVSNSGNLLLQLYFPKGDRLSKAVKEEALAQALARSSEFMFQKGYLPPEVRFMSSRDVAQKYGFTRQYWEKLLREGKIAYKETRAGRITTNLWVEGYLQNKEAVDEYVRHVRKAVRVIQDQRHKHGTTQCPKCSMEQFEYHDNQTNIDGLCRDCGFKLRVVAEQKEN